MTDGNQYAIGKYLYQAEEQERYQELLDAERERDELSDRIEELTAERERLALAICGGEDAPGYANAQTVETLEKIARDNINATMAQINCTLAVEAKLAKAVDALRQIEQGWVGEACPDTGELIQVNMAMDEAEDIARAALADLKGGN